MCIVFVFINYEETFEEVDPLIDHGTFCLPLGIFLNCFGGHGKIAKILLLLFHIQDKDRKDTKSWRAYL